MRHIAASVAALILSTVHPAASADSKPRADLVNTPIMVCDDPDRIHFIVTMEGRGIDKSTSARTLNWVFRQMVCAFVIPAQTKARYERDVDSFILGETRWTIKEWEIVTSRPIRVAGVLVIFELAFNGYTASSEVMPPT